MTAHWEPLFDELAELDSAARRGRLAELRAGDPGLARFIGKLLEADSAPTSALETPVALRASGFVAAALAESEPVADRDRSGERIGAWRLVSQLGRGGMAEVYLAERVDGEFEQRAALKLVRAEVGSAAIHRRFLRERRILAQLEHPGIARLLDGGRTPGGEPYFVLELVEGARITDHCEAGSLPLAERLRLFAEVCDAVDAAHRRLVVHRDLKPSNILVTPAGEVKLLDFGIAKLLDSDRESGTPIVPGSGSVTKLEAQPLTPSYAAPEQILGEPISTATDVFALGILLYELVAGRPPFERRAASRGALAIEVASETLTSPSAALRKLAASPERVDRDLLRRRAAEVDPDLDKVIGKALSREPERRYHSAAALADDVHSFLERRPVRARPDSLRYRASRFVARNRGGVALAAAATVALLALLAVALAQGVQARRQAQRAERVRSFLVELFKEADPSRTRGATLTAREMLAAGTARVERELAAEPEVAAELFDAIAQVELSLGLSSEAAARARSSIALAAVALGPTATPTLASQVTLAEALFGEGDLDGAAAAVEAALPLLDRRTEPALADRLLAIEANLLVQKGELQAALEKSRRALAISIRRSGQDSLETLMWTTRLAGTLTDASRVAEAVELLRPILPQLAQSVAGNPLHLAEIRLAAGEILDYAGARTEGEALIEGAVEILRSTIGVDHPEVAFAEIKLGYMRFEHRDLAAAERDLLHAATVLDAIGHYEAGSARRYLGFVLYEKGEYAAALDEFERAERTFLERIPDEKLYLLSSRLSQAWALLRLGEPKRAEVLLEKITPEIERSLGPESSSFRTALKYLGEARRMRGAPREALELHRRARELEVRIFGTEEHTSVAASDYQIALDQLAVGGPAAIADARTRIDRALACQRRSEPEGARLADFLVASARIAAAQKDRARAAQDATEARALLVATRGADHPVTREALASLPF